MVEDCFLISTCLCRNDSKPISLRDSLWFYCFQYANGYAEGPFSREQLQKREPQRNNGDDVVFSSLRGSVVVQVLVFSGGLGLCNRRFRWLKYYQNSSSGQEE